jgi:hypothetical protein
MPAKLDALGVDNDLAMRAVCALDALLDYVAHAVSI